jgi:AraC-like DNA-binding protein
MAAITRTPRAALRPFVRVVWVSDERDAAGERERMLGSGATNLVFRLCGPPVRLYGDPTDPAATTIGHAVVGGARATFYLRDTPRPLRTVGAVLLPGAAGLLFGAPAGELAGRHTPLFDLWGREAAEARERLLVAGDPARQLDLFEAMLAARLPEIRGLHPAVAHALARLPLTGDVGAVVDETGYSHRRFVALFREAVGLPPKLYCRVLRLQTALRLLASRPSPALADVALAAGYSDQPHLNRELRELAGVSPSEYRAAAPASLLHVPLPPGSIPSKTPSGGRSMIHSEGRIP